MKSFTLVELMIVVAIIAVLVAVALPVYNNYIIRTNILNVFPYIERFNKSLMEHIENNDTSFPFTIEGQYIPDALPVNYIGDSEIFYQVQILNESHPDLNSDELMMCFYMPPSLGVVAGNGSTNPRICMIVSLNEGVFRKYCGTLDTPGPTNAEMPSEYLPSGCNCTEMRLPGRSC